MKITQTIALRFCLFLFSVSALTACGQKGPIEVEQPVLTQEEVLEETI